MSPLFKKYGSIIISVIGALAIVATAVWAKGTQYTDTAWLYTFCIWLALFFAFEIYSKSADKK